MNLALSVALLVLFGVYLVERAGLLWLRHRIGRDQTFHAKQQRATVALPPEILQLVAQESESWARSGLSERAHEIYVETGDWPSVQATLRQEMAR